MQKKLQIIEKNNQRVLTTAQLAEVFGTDSKRLNRNFQRNSQRFIEGKQFFALSGDELKEFKMRYPYPEFKFASILYLWTFSGCVLQGNAMRDVPIRKIYEIAEVLEMDTENLVIAGECSKEYEFGELLDSIIPKGVQIDKQFVIGEYRLDFYLPYLELIIEFDEHEHEFKQLVDKKRENKIKEYLPNVQFIRVNETDIYSGIKQITSFVYNKIGGMKYVTSNYWAK